MIDLEYIVKTEAVPEVMFIFRYRLLQAKLLRLNYNATINCVPLFAIIIKAFLFIIFTR